MHSCAAIPLPDGFNTAMQITVQDLPTAGKPRSLKAHILIDGIGYELSVSVATRLSRIESPVKEPWKLSRGEFHGVLRARHPDYDVAAANRAHKAAVARAILDGCEVPEQAVSDYADLRARLAASGARKPLDETARSRHAAE
jgi:hypothetical protein